MDTDLFVLLRGDIKEGFEQVTNRLDQLNGRVRETEQEVAVLKDRDGRRVAVWGSLGVGIATAAQSAWNWLKP